MKNKTSTFIASLLVLLLGNQINAQDVNLEWAKHIGGSNKDVAYSIAVDALGNVYTTGYFHETADFDPGPEIFNLTSAGEGDIFVQKLDDSGNLLWVRQIGGTELDWPVSINVDESGNVYTAGNFIGIVDFDPGISTRSASAGKGRPASIISTVTSGCAASGSRSSKFAMRFKRGTTTLMAPPLRVATSITSLGSIFFTVLNSVDSGILIFTLFCPSSPSPTSSPPLSKSS